MKVTSVTYRKLVSSRHDFRHEALEATAAVKEGEDPVYILAELRRWVDGHLSLPVEEAIRSENEQLERLHRLTEDARRDLDEQIQKVTDAKAFVAGLGLPTDRFADMPF